MDGYSDSQSVMAVSTTYFLKGGGVASLEYHGLRYLTRRDDVRAIYIIRYNLTYLSTSGKREKCRACNNNNISSG